MTYALSFRVLGYSIILGMSGCSRHIYHFRMVDLATATALPDVHISEFPVGYNYLIDPFLGNSSSASSGTDGLITLQLPASGRDFDVVFERKGYKSAYAKISNKDSNHMLLLTPGSITDRRRIDQVGNAVAVQPIIEIPLTKETDPGVRNSLQDVAN